MTLRLTRTGASAFLASATLVPALAATASLAAEGCRSSGDGAPPIADATTEAQVSYVDANRDASLADPCRLPGSIQFTAAGPVVVAGAREVTPDLTFLHLPTGFCAHYYATVGNARQLRVAPGGELFVASPTMTTTGGGAGGLAEIVVLPDDDGDGIADQTVPFLQHLASTQGLLFANGRFYYQDGSRILSLPYAAGDRAPSGAETLVADIHGYVSGIHWPKTLDIADDGTIFVGNGGDQNESCDPDRPVRGGIFRLDGADGGTPVAKGLRNPINVRCARGHNQCFAIELGKDYSNSEGGHEKLVPIHDLPNDGGAIDDWGFPCCATRNVPFSDVSPIPDCSGVTADNNAFFIGDTPFGVDFETGQWPAPWSGSAFVVTHGICCGSWSGARIVSIAMDPVTGLPLASSDVGDGGMYGSNQGAMVDFATGWDDGSHMHGRPAAITFAPDGRLFVANDNNGVIFWIAAMKDDSAQATGAGSMPTPLPTPDAGASDASALDAGGD